MNAKHHPSSSRMSRCRWCIFFLLAVVCAISWSLVHALDEDNDGGAANAESSTSDASTASSGEASTATSEPPPKAEENIPSGDEKDWGSFYDPNNVFCGKFDCYKILGFDYEQWGNDPPSLKDITKSYRSLSRKWHPDKNKAKGAREKFVVSRSALLIFVYMLHGIHLAFPNSTFNPNHPIIDIVAFFNILYCFVHNEMHRCSSDDSHRKFPRPTKYLPTKTNGLSMITSVIAPTNTLKSTDPLSYTPSPPNRMPPSSSSSS